MKKIYKPRVCLYCKRGYVPIRYDQSCCCKLHGILYEEHSFKNKVGIWRSVFRNLKKKYRDDEKIISILTEKKNNLEKAISWIKSGEKSLLYGRKET